MRQLEYYQDMLRCGRMSRREFLGRATALGVALPLATSLAGKAIAATPNKGGRLRQACTGGGTSDTLDPAQILDSYMIQTSFGMLRNNLTEIDQDGSLIGELAESWESTPDATTWTFKLRKGVEFHNGKTLDANDVVQSFNHHRGEESKSAAKGIVDPIEDVKADGDNVVFQMKGGNADFPFLVSDYHLGICPAKAEGGIDWESGVGTGGYVLDTFDPGVVVLAHRNPSYWKQGRAHFDEVEHRFISDVGARTTALQTGDMDIITNIELKTVHLLQRDSSIQVISTTGNKHCTLPMLTDVAPYDNVDVRLALKYAINREEWLQKLIRGYGELGNDHPVGPANIYRATDLEQRQYDPDKAKFHLKKAGMEGHTFRLHVADTAFEGAVDGAQLYQESAKAAGINIEIVRAAEDGYWSDVWLKQPWCASYWGGRPTEDWVFSQIYAAGADWNETHWNNERFNELLVQGRAELDSEKRREIYHEMQVLVRDDGGAVIPMFLAYVEAASDKVYVPEQRANNWELDGHKNLERWWFV